MPKIGYLALWRRTLRNMLTGVRVTYLNRVWGMHIGPGCSISWEAKLDKTNPKGVYIGKDSAVSFGASILTHDFVRLLHKETRIGERCQIGAYSIIFPGVTIGDGSIIAAGSVVMRDVPPGCIASGNPARVIEKGLRTGKWGLILGRESTDNLTPPQNPTEQAVG